MTLLAVGLFSIALGGGLLLSRRPLAGWNARMSDQMTSQHIKDVAGPDEGAPRYIAGIGALILIAGVVLAAVGLSQL